MNGSAHRSEARDDANEPEDIRPSEGSLGEWLHRALLAREEAARPDADATRPHADPDADEWRVPADDVGAALDSLARRLEAGERRQGLALSGLDRAVLGLATRVEEAEGQARRASTNVQGAVGDLRRAATEIAQRLEGAEAIARTSAERATAAITDLDRRLEFARTALERDWAEAEERRRAETTALFERLASAQTLLGERLEGAERQANATLNRIETERTDIEGRVDALLATGREESAKALKAETAALEARISETAASAQAAAQTALAGARRAFDQLTAKLDEVSRGAGADAGKLADQIETVQAALADRIATAETVARDAAERAAAESRSAREHLEGRLAAMERAAEQTAETIRAGAASAIGQMRAAQLEMQAKLDVVERLARADETRVALEQRLARLEKEGAKGLDRSALHMLDAKITALAGAMRDAKDRMAAEMEALADGRGAGDVSERLQSVEQSVEHAIAGLADRLGRAEAAAQQAVAAAEAGAGAPPDANALRALMDDRLEGLTAQLSAMVGDVRVEVAAQIAALAPNEDAAELQSALADVNKRIAAAERRQAQTVEAISVEIKRMSEGVDRRLRTLEARNDDAAAEAVRDEVARLSSVLDARILVAQTRETAGFDRMGAEIGRLAERFDQRFEDVERRSAEAIEHVGTQVARVSERISQRQEQLAAELSARVAHSEDRHGSRLDEALGALSAKLADVEDRTHSALSPLQRAMATFASRLQAVEDAPGAPSLAFAEPIALEPLPVAGPTTIEDHDLADADDVLSQPEPVAEAPVWRETELDVAEEEIQFDAQDQEEPRPAPAKTPDPDDLFAEEDLPPAKSDYLQAARRAAQAQAAAGGKAKAEGRSLLPLKGRLKLFGFGAGALAIAIAGGSMLLRSGADDNATQTADARPPAPQALPEVTLPSPAHSVEAPASVQVAAAITPKDETVAAASIAEAAAKAKTARPPAPSPGPSVRPALASGATLEQAASRGDPVAQYELALAHLGSGSQDEGVLLLRRAANQGLAMAQYRLGKLYERGEGVPPDLILARQWTERAAAAGNRKAMHDLGVFYARGEGVELDEAAAFRWFRQAAEMGVADSQYNLGVLYQQGRGVAADAAEALYWFAVAAKAGDLDARAKATALQAQLGPERGQDILVRAEAFAARPASARANGEFGQRGWARVTAEGAPTPRS